MGRDETFKSTIYFFLTCLFLNTILAHSLEERSTQKKNKKSQSLKCLKTIKTYTVNQIYPSCYLILLILTGSLTSKV